MTALNQRVPDFVYRYHCQFFITCYIVTIVEILSSIITENDFPAHIQLWRLMSLSLLMVRTV